MDFRPLVWGDTANWPYIGYVKTFFPNPEFLVVSYQSCRASSCFLG